MVTYFHMKEGIYIIRNYCGLNSQKCLSSVGLHRFLIKKTNSLDIHSKNLQLMMIEVFKSLNHIGPEIIWDTFEIRDIPYELRQGQTIRTLHANKLQTLNLTFVLHKPGTNCRVTLNLYKAL